MLGFHVIGGLGFGCVDGEGCHIVETSAVHHVLVDRLGDWVNRLVYLERA